MSVKSITVNADNEIVGTQTTATLAPGNIEVDASVLDAVRAARATISALRMDARPLWINNQVELPADTRDLYEITCDRDVDPAAGAVVMEADGVDSITVTVKLMLDESTVDASVTETRLLPTDSGALWRMEFVNGVATKVFRTTQSGRLDVEQSPAYRLVAPFVILSVL
jgi:hypothetical protein